jgi:hypothetical protein
LVFLGVEQVIETLTTFLLTGLDRTGFTGARIDLDHFVAARAGEREEVFCHQELGGGMWEVALILVVKPLARNG